MVTKKVNVQRLSDGELLRLWREERRREYAGALFGRYLPLVYGVCLKYLGSAVRAAERTREVAAGLQDMMVGGIGAEDDFGEWLYGRLLDGFGVRASEQARLGGEQCRFVSALAAGDDEAAAVFETAAPGLTKPQRETIRRFFVDGESFETIAAATGYLTGDVRSYVESGVRAMVGERVGAAPGKTKKKRNAL